MRDRKLPRSRGAAQVIVLVLLALTLCLVAWFVFLREKETTGFGNQGEEGPAEPETEAPLERKETPPKKTEEPPLPGDEFKNPARPGKQGEAGPKGPIPPFENPDDPSEALNRLISPDLSDEARVDALRRLKQWEDRKGELVGVLMEILHTADQPELKAKIILEAQGIKDHGLISPLVMALASSPSAKVRQAAASTLIDYANVAPVLTALEQAMNTDGSEGVREQARRTIEKFTEGRR